MKNFTRLQGALVCFWLSVFFVAVEFCYGSTVELVGIGECADCKEYNIKTSQAFSGLHVAVDCKAASGHFETRGFGELDKNGNFKLSLPHDIVKSGELKEECYAQLHSASAAPCPAHDGLPKTKIVIKSKGGDNDKHTLGPIGNLKFSSVTCPSAFFLPFFKHPLLPKLPPHPHFHFPPKVFPPFPPKGFPKHPYFHHKKPLPPPVKKPLPPPVPVYKKPCPPPVPVYKKPNPPPVPVYKKPTPPHVPVYKKPHPAPVPVYKKPLPPPVPKVKKPSPPKYKHPLLPPVPIHKKPLPPLPPFPKLPPFKPLPPLPPLPKIPSKHFFHHPKFGKWPPLPHPKNFFHHPKFGKWPPLPPLSPHP